MKPPNWTNMDYQHINSKNMIFYNNILKMMIQIQSNLKYIWRDDIVITLYSDFVSAKVRFKVYNSGSRNQLRTDDLEKNPQLRVQPLVCCTFLVLLPWAISTVRQVVNRTSIHGVQPANDPMVHPNTKDELLSLKPEFPESVPCKLAGVPGWEFRHCARWKYNEAHKVWTIPMLAFHSEQFALQQW